MTEGLLWYPLAGPQTQAYLSEADELFYGGAAGGGKSQLGLGLSINEHFNSLILRREATQLTELMVESRTIIGKAARFNGSLHTWTFPNGQRIEFGGCEQEDDKQKYKGRAKDLYVFDELSDFLESQYVFITTWNRSTRTGQRCRIVGTGNPPTTPEGAWVVKRWAAWLDPKHPNPALPGELRWYATIDGKDTEVKGRDPIKLPNGEVVMPTSRTFQPAKLEDNPILDATNYRARLQARPEPLRSQMLYGDFTIGLKDDAWQVIPTDWVRQAQARWEALEEQAQAEGKEHYHPVQLDDLGAVKLNEEGEEIPSPLTSAGVDVARGGDDEFVVSRRIHNWFAPLDTWPGSMVPNGPAGAGLVNMSLAEEVGDVSEAYINVDSIGVGASVYDVLSEQGLNVLAINFAARAYGTDRTGLQSFVNLRAYAYWSLREALDPVRGDDLALPPSQKLLGDLTSAQWRQRSNGIQIRDKEEIKEKLGRSPDEGDAVVLAALPDFGLRLS